MLLSRVGAQVSQGNYKQTLAACLRSRGGDADKSLLTVRVAICQLTNLCVGVGLVGCADCERH